MASLPPHEHPAPWSLEGEAMIALAWWSGRRPPLPTGAVRAPGPCLVMGLRVDESPVGPFVECSVAEPALFGGRLGWCVTMTAVSSSDARVGALLNWGLPAEVAELVWEADGPRARLRWRERGLELTTKGQGAVVPGVLRVRALQRRSDGPVSVPMHMHGMGRTGVVRLTTTADDPVRALRGRHAGVRIRSLHYVREPARPLIGLLADLRPSPLRPAEPTRGQPSPVP